MKRPSHINASTNKTPKSIYTHVLTYVCVLALTPFAAYADCTAPAGVTGEMIYNADHKVMQYCDGTNWIGAGIGQTITDGNKGDITVTNNGETWAINPRSCPTGMTASIENFCYTDLQPAANIVHAQTACKNFKNADTCTVGEYYQIETGSTMRWTNSYCNGTQGVVVTTGSGWSCAAYNTNYQYRCCANLR